MLASSRSWRSLGPAVLSIGLAGCLAAFILQNWHPMKINSISMAATDAVGSSPVGFGHSFTDHQIEAGVASFILATMFLFVPLVLLLRRWALPFGTAVVLLSVQCLLMQAMVGFRDGGLAALGVIGSVLVEAAVSVIRPAPASPNRIRVFAFVAPIVFWSTYVIGIAANDQGLGWKPELWTGSLLWTGLVTVTFATLTTSERGLRDY